MKNPHHEELNIALVQPDVYWENKEDNLKQYTRYIDIIKADHPAVDLVVLPEMFSTGFTLKPASNTESMKGPTIEWMEEIAVEKEVAVCGSIIINEEDKFYNRFVFAEPGKEIVYYDKRHLFGYAGEDKNYTAGTKKITIDFKGWKINPFICYDLRFPVWCRNTNQADIMLYVANWPETRIEHWKKLLPARAIENQCFVIGVNRVGEDENELNYSGQSCAYDPMGNCLGSMGDQEGYTIINLQKIVVISNREKIPFWKDGDDFEIKL